MATYQIDWHWFHASGYAAHTIDIVIAPASVGVQVNLHGDTGAESGAYVGIKGYNKRLPSGQDEEHDFGEWLSWPPALFERISSVTLAATAGKNQTAWLVARMDYWQ